MMICHVGFGQSKGTKIYASFQNPGTEETLKKLALDITGFNTNERLFIIHLKPASCPRCEGMVNQIVRYLKEIDSHCRTLMVIDYPSRKTAVAYYGTRKFITDTLYVDTSGLFTTIFNYDESSLMSPFIYSINIKNGKLLSYLPFLGLSVDKITLSKFYNETVPDDKQSDKDSRIKFEAPSKYEYQNTLQLFSNTHIIPDKRTYFSDPLFTFVNAKDSLFSFVDRLTKSVIIFNWNKDTSYIGIHPKLEEYLKLTDTNVLSIKDQVKNIRDNITNVIYLSILNQHDSTITITASLPKYIMTTSNEDTIYTYFNVISFLHKNFRNKLLNIDSLRGYKDNRYSPSHAKTVQIGNRLFIPVERGWPVTGTDDAALSIKDNNPFEEEYYKLRDLFAVYDNSRQEFVHNIGLFDSIFIKFKCGYMYTQPLIAANDQYYFITDSRSGTIQIVNRSNDRFVKALRLFDVNPNPKTLYRNMVVAENGSSTEKMSYLMALKSVFNRVIKDIIVLNDMLYAVVYDDYYHLYYLHMYNLSNNTQKIILLDTTDINNKLLYSIKLGCNNNSVSLYTFYQLRNEYKLSIDQLNY